MTKKRTLTTPEERQRFMNLSASRSRHAVREAEQRQIQMELDQWMRRWKDDPESILSEYRWRCPGCGQAVEPFVIDGLHGRPIVGRKDRCECGYWSVEEDSDD